MYDSQRRELANRPEVEEHTSSEVVVILNINFG